MNVRIEKDSMGEVEVPADALYGAQTQRAINNFTISGRVMPRAFIEALLHIKAAAAAANVQLQKLPADCGEAVISAADTMLCEQDLLLHFPVDIYQTGSGTSSNMNVNEVLATVASRRLGKPVSANDHVNCGQSSNDVIPTAIHVSAVMVLDSVLLPALRHLAAVIRQKQEQLDGYIKTGRTHLMDAMPVRMSQSVGAWRSQVEANIDRLETLKAGLYRLAQGGTAVGTGVNSHARFPEQFCIALNGRTGQRFVPADNFFAALSSQDEVVALSGQLKATAVSLMKIANDLRWMNSGPLSGLGEIELEALQPGSSIMPGKVNPVIPEAVTMVAARVMGNDCSIGIAGQSGNFELNVMLPLIADNVLDSVQILGSASVLLADKAIATFKVNEANLVRSLARNPILATALNPVIGYMQAAEIAKSAYKQGRPVLDVAREMTELSDEQLESLLDPANLTMPGSDD